MTDVAYSVCGLFVSKFIVGRALDVFCAGALTPCPPPVVPPIGKVIISGLSSGTSLICVALFSFLLIGVTLPEEKPEEPAAETEVVEEVAEPTPVA